MQRCLSSGNVHLVVIGCWHLNNTSSFRHCGNLESLAYVSLTPMRITRFLLSESPLCLKPFIHQPSLKHLTSSTVVLEPQPQCNVNLLIAFISPLIKDEKHFAKRLLKVIVVAAGRRCFMQEMINTQLTWKNEESSSLLMKFQHIFIIGKGMLFLNYFFIYWPKQFQKV